MSHVTCNEHVACNMWHDFLDTRHGMQAGQEVDAHVEPLPIELLHTILVEADHGGRSPQPRLDDVARELRHM